MRNEKLTNAEKETIIIFNETTEPATIFTYSKSWQKHLEGRLGLKPVRKEEYGGREYSIDKDRIKPPRAPVKMSEEAKLKLIKNITKGRPKNAVHSTKNTSALGKQAKEKPSKTSATRTGR